MKSDAPVARDEALVPCEETLPQPSEEAPEPSGVAAGEEPRGRRWPWVAGIGVDLARYEVLVQEASIKSDQAQVESAKLNLTYSRITSPISGTVGLPTRSCSRSPRARWTATGPAGSDSCHINVGVHKDLGKSPVILSEAKHLPCILRPTPFSA